MMYYYILKYKTNIVFYQAKEKNDSKEGERHIYYEDLIDKTFAYIKDFQYLCSKIKN